MQPQGNKNLQVGGPQMLHGSNFTKGSQADTDEFIYGFPSDSLSTVSYRWWGKSSYDGSTDSSVKGCEANSVASNTIASTTDGENLQNKKHESSIDSLETGPLSSLRKRAAKEGREALKLGVHRRHATNKLQQKNWCVNRFSKPRCQANGLMNLFSLMVDYLVHGKDQLCHDMNSYVIVF